MTEFHEQILVCALIFVALGGGLVLFHFAGLLYLGIRGWWRNRNDKGMIGRRVA